MALAAHRREGNITRTLQMRIGDTVTTATGLVVPVLHRHAFADPDAARDDTGTPLQRFVVTNWISGGAGANGASILQADVFTRIGAEDAATRDPFGLVCSEIGDALVEKFGGLDGDYPRWWIPVLDFADPANPVSTREHILCQSSAGRDGSPDDRLPTFPSGGLQRQVLRWRFVLIQDAAGPAAFYKS